MRNLTLLLGAGLWLCLVAPMHAQMAQTTPLLVAEQMPYFPGCPNTDFSIDNKRQCSDETLIHFITDNMIYPETAKGYGIEGTVIVQFIVNESGQLSDYEIIRNIGGGCGEAALNVLRRMPKWEPAVDNGTFVKVALTLPIHFSLENEEANIAENYNITWGNIHQTQVTKAQLIQNLNEKLYVRDAMGNHLLIDELIFSFEKKNKVISGKSRGQVDEELIKIVEKTKKGGELHIRASVQNDGQFFYVGKSFMISD